VYKDPQSPSSLLDETLDVETLSKLRACTVTVTCYTKRPEDVVGAKATIGRNLG
jgi:hypothetical protein